MHPKCNVSFVCKIQKIYKLTKAKIHKTSFLFMHFLLSYLIFSLQIITSTISIHRHNAVCSSHLVMPGCCESELSFSRQLSVYQHAGFPASWCLLGWRGRLGKPGCHSGGRWAPPSGTVMPSGTDGAVSEPRDGDGTCGRGERERHPEPCVCQP